jgi:spore coat protein CotF
MKNKNNQTVKNKEQPVTKSTEMNDCDYLNDLLSTEKSLASHYVIALNEASNDDLYNELIKVYKDTQDCQRDLFNLLFKKGWYKIEEAEEQKIMTERDEFENKLKELPQ